VAGKNPVSYHKAVAKRGATERKRNRTRKRRRRKRRRQEEGYVGRQRNTLGAGESNVFYQQCLTRAKKEKKRRGTRGLRTRRVCPPSWGEVFPALEGSGGFSSPTSSQRGPWHYKQRMEG